MPVVGSAGFQHYDRSHRHVLQHVVGCAAKLCPQGLQPPQQAHTRKKKSTQHIHFKAQNYIKKTN
jgi:hypothetical protein